MQFQQPLAQFEMVKEKIAYMAAGAFAMEAATYQTAALIDSGEGDYMLETAMLKVFSTEVLWRIINDTIQIFGGKAYFTDEPYERLMRDARINMIGEGANDVLRAFIALVGMRDVGLELQGVLEAAKTPWRNLGKLGSFAGQRIEAMFAAPAVERAQHRARPRSAAAGQTGLAARLAGRAAAGPLPREHPRPPISARPHRRRRHRDLRQRLRAAPARSPALAHDLPPADWAAASTAGRYYLLTAERRIRRSLDDLWSNDDQATTELADLVLERQRAAHR